jgi:Tol biopolymer transport system component
VKVLDFGLAKLTQPAASEDGSAETALRTGEGVVLGTAAYMSPEQAEARPVDARSDIFSFGSMLYEMATGQRAFAGTTPASTISAILRDDPKPPHELRPEIPAELTRVISRCLRKDPARRFQHAADLKVALEELKEESDSGRLAPPASATRSSARRTWIGAGVAAIVVLAAGIGALRMFRATAPPVDNGPRLLPLTTERGRALQPTFSPDGNQVAYVWNGEREDNFDIYVKLVGPGAPLRLTANPAADEHPVWSPDGRTIAFTRQIGEDRFALMLVPPLGGPERKIAEFPGTSFFGNLDPGALAWTPDSKSLIVSGTERLAQPNRLLLVSVETGESRAITNPVGQTADLQGVVSPDGRTLAFIRSIGMNLTSLYTVPLSAGFIPSGEPRKEQTGDLPVFYPAWTSDGDLIVAAGNSSAAFTLERVQPGGSAPPVPMGWVGVGAYQPAVSTASHRLAYVRAVRDTNIWRLELGTKDARPQPLIASTLREVFPRYSPDGKRISFHSDRDGAFQVWVCNADGTNAGALTHFPNATSGTARWSPQGDRLSFDSNESGNWEIYTVGADGGKPTKLTNHVSTNIAASWSHDGQWIYFGSNRTGEFQIWKVPAHGGDAVQVTHHGGTDALESRDGGTLYFTRQDGQGGIWKMPVAGGEETQVLDAPVYRFNFDVTDAGLYYTPPPAADGSSSVQYLAFATGARREIVKITRLDLGLALSPDGKYLLFAQTDNNGSSLMLAENFR